MSFRNRPDSQIDEQLTILRAVDAAHQNRRISSKLRYQILQSLFPAFENGSTGVHDFWFEQGTPSRRKRTSNSSPDPVHLPR